MSEYKYRQVAEMVRAQIDSGEFPPGASVPSGAELARQLGYSNLTCRKALQTLIQEGVLLAGASLNSRPVVPVKGAAAQERFHAARNLSQGLAVLRHAADLTQLQLAEATGVSVTSVCHAETGRLWHSRSFWESADNAVNAGGRLLALHDAYIASALGEHPLAADTARADEVPPTPSSLMILWSNGEITSIPLERSSTP